MDRDIYYYRYVLKNGLPVDLLPEAGGRYKVLYQGEHLGSYSSPQSAADDVSGGHTFTPSDGTDFSRAGVPEYLGEWTKKLFATVERLRKS